MNPIPVSFVSPEPAPASIHDQRPPREQDLSLREYVLSGCVEELQIEAELGELTALLLDLKLISSKSEAERLIKQGGVEIDGARIDDPRKDIDLSKPAEFLLRAGKKKFVRVVVE